MRKLLLTTGITAALATSASALTFEHPQLYKDPKVMGMGGANVAVGGHASSVFYNPAGLAKIPSEYGIEVELINLSASINENIVDFGTDLSDATDDPGDRNDDGTVNSGDETLAAMDVMRQYMGKNIHFDVNNMLSVSRKGEKIAFAVAPFGGASFDFRTYDRFDEAMDVQGIAYGGVALAGSYDFSDIEMGKYALNDFSLGLGIKQVMYMSVGGEDGRIGITDYIDNKDDFGEYIQDELLQEGTSTVLDLGGTYEVLPDMDVGLSIMNIGGIGSKDAVYIPMTVNAGVGYTKRWEGHMFFNQVRAAFDWVDMTAEYEQDEDFLKRTRLGLEANAWDGWFSTLTLRAGLYQAAPTYGLNLRLTMLQIGYAYYQEEVGAYAGQDRDARHMVNLTFGW